MSERIVFNEARIGLHNISGKKLRGIVEELGVELKVEEVNPHQYAETMSHQSEQMIRSYLLWPDENFKNILLSKGFKLVVETSQETGLSMSRGVYIHLNKMYPNWRAEAYSVVRNDHKAYLIPPWISTALETYDKLGHERQMLGVWRSMRSRKIMHYEDYLLNDLNSLTEKRKRELRNDGIIAQRIFMASGLINLDQDDLEMLANLSAVDLFFTYVHLIHLSFKEVKHPTKTREEAIIYMRCIIGDLKFNTKSQRDFPTILKQTISNFISK